MEARQRVENLLNRAKKLGLVNPITDEGAPTPEMLTEMVIEAEADAGRMQMEFDRRCRIADQNKGRSKQV